MCKNEIWFLRSFEDTNMTSLTCTILEITSPSATTQFSEFVFLNSNFIIISITISQFTMTAVKSKLIQRFMCFLSVNHVYGTGKQCNDSERTEKAYTKYLCYVKEYMDGSGIFKHIEEFKPRAYKEDVMKARTKEKALTADNIWDDGMLVRREVTTFIADFGKEIKFKTINTVC